MVVDIWGNLLKWWVSPTGPWENPTKNDQHLGCDMGVLYLPPFKETPLVNIESGMQTYRYLYL